MVEREHPGFARRHLAELERHRGVPSPHSTPESRLANLETAWRAIDAAVAAVPEIRFEALRHETSDLRRFCD